MRGGADGARLCRRAAWAGLHSPCQRGPLPQAEGSTPRRSPVPPRHPPAWQQLICQREVPAAAGEVRELEHSSAPGSLPGTSTPASRQIPPARDCRDGCSGWSTVPAQSAPQAVEGDRVGQQSSLATLAQGMAAQPPLHPLTSGTSQGTGCPRREIAACRIPSQPAWIPAALSSPEQYRALS